MSPPPTLFQQRNWVPWKFVHGTKFHVTEKLHMNCLVNPIKLCTPWSSLPDCLNDFMKSNQFLLPQNRWQKSVECWLPSADGKIKVELPDGACHCLKEQIGQSSSLPQNLVFALPFTFFFNIYCILKNRNTCFCQSLHGIPDEKPLKEKNKMQFESKSVKLPRHTKPGPLGRSG